MTADAGVVPSSPMILRPGILELTPERCLRLLKTVSVGRVGVTVDALPSVLPVNFVVDDGTIVFRTVRGSKLDTATVGMVVAFEADHYGAETDRWGWSVLVRGVAEEITESADLERVRSLPLESWAFDGSADRYLKIAPTLISGRRIIPPEGVT
jgi:nitroimidazol reductase NimA-like FMN-containing flavoprotein (pyridoxamine 5'-phosphate oxidase superfamily)